MKIEMNLKGVPDYYTLVNKMKTPDGTILQCKHRHDYRSYKDKVTGEEYMLDGLGHYTRTSINEVPGEYTRLTAKDDFREVREHYYVHFGGDSCLLKDISNTALDTILYKYNKNADNSLVFQLLFLEKNYRDFLNLSAINNNV